MKKALTIGGIVLGVLLIGWLIIMIFVPGLFTYIRVKHKYKHIDDRLETFVTVAVPQDFTQHTIEGVKISVPDSYSQGSSEHILRDGEKSVMVMSMDMSALGSYYDPWDSFKYEESDYRSYFRAVGAEFPSVYKPSADILWYEKDVLTSKDCLKLRGRNRKIFLELAENKDGSYKMEDSWKLPISGGTVYVSQSKENDLVSYDYWSVEAYPENGGSEYFFIMLRGESEEVTKQMISSIEFK